MLCFTIEWQKMTKIDWKPIETAPRPEKPEPKASYDNIYILLATSKEFLGIGYYDWDNWSKCPKPYFALKWSHSEILWQPNNQPTHWAEMPNLPNVDDELACGTVSLS